MCARVCCRVLPFLIIPTTTKGERRQGQGVILEGPFGVPQPLADAREPASWDYHWTRISVALQIIANQSADSFEIWMPFWAKLMEDANDLDLAPVYVSSCMLATRISQLNLHL